MQQTIRMLAQLARYVAREGSNQPLATRMCLACTDILGAGGGAITLAYTQPERFRLSATDASAAQLDDLQEITGEGPSHEAYRKGQWVEATFGDPAVDAEAARRWPILDQAIRESLGACTVYALPILPRVQVMGVMTLYQLIKQPLLVEQSAAMVLVDAVGVALVDGPAADAGLTTGQETWPERARTHQATGMVMAQLFISADDALALLRAHAYAHDMTLAEVSARVVSRELNFAHTDPDPESDR